MKSTQARDLVDYVLLLLLTTESQVPQCNRLFLFVVYRRYNSQECAGPVTFYMIKNFLRNKVFHNTLWTRLNT
jgi:hypothetical protein